MNDIHSQKMRSALQTEEMRHRSKSTCTTRTTKTLGHRPKSVVVKPLSESPTTPPSTPPPPRPPPPPPPPPPSRPPRLIYCPFDVTTSCHRPQPLPRVAYAYAASVDKAMIRDVRSLAGGRNTILPPWFAATQYGRLPPPPPYGTPHWTVVPSSHYVPVNVRYFAANSRFRCGDGSGGASSTTKRCYAVDPRCQPDRDAKRFSSGVAMSKIERYIN